MAKITVVDDSPMVLEQLVEPLVRAGYRVLSELAPVDFDEVMHFGAQLIVVGLDRSKSARNRSIGDPMVDIIGYKALVEMEQYPAINLVPIMLAAHGIDEADIPTTLNYDLFLDLPSEWPLYLPKVQELVASVKTRRKISGYVCPGPGCGSRLVTLQNPENLFCPKCGAGVSLTPDGDCSWCDAEGRIHHCNPEGLVPPAVKRRQGRDS